ncbi:hypothetical protein L7F22_000255 [Adiantum nelumboides]|nr:hypothetical protein [Adiantum nelumboides]
MMIGRVAEEDSPIRTLAPSEVLQEVVAAGVVTAPPAMKAPSWAVSISREDLVERAMELHAQIAALDDLRPSERVNTLFSALVELCLHPCAVDLDKELSGEEQAARKELIKLCGEAEGLLEHHWSAVLGAFSQPHVHLHLFPYYRNYVKLAHAEFRELCAAASTAMAPKLAPASPPTVGKFPGCMSPAGACACATFTRVAFVGSGPMPLTSIVLALNHMPWATFHNFDLDAGANDKARALVRHHPDLASRMVFFTRNIKKVKLKMADYDLVFLAALVGMDRASKTDFLHHLARYMRPGATLVVRSAHSGRAFLYPIVHNNMLLEAGFEVLSEFHPTDEVVNSVIVARKRPPLQQFSASLR